MKNIILWGSSLHAKYTIDIIEKENKYTIACLYDPVRTEDASIYQYRVYGKSHDFADLVRKHNVEAGLVAIGDNWVRREEHRHIQSLLSNFKFVNAIHPSTIFGRDTRLGRGIVIMAGVVIENDTVIEDGCFLATNSSVDHDSTLRAFSSISAGVTVGGSVELGECAFLAIGSTVVSGIKIGGHTVMGAGSVVLNDIPDHVLAYGVPAKVIRERKEGEKYLSK